MNIGNFKYVFYYNINKKYSFSFPIMEIYFMSLFKLEICLGINVEQWKIIKYSSLTFCVAFLKLEQIN